jgi:hypothetical protein
LPSPEHPDTGALLLGKTVPFWDEVLEVAMEAQRLTGLGYGGVDIALVEKKGPVVMEVNRRPGLEIQNANAAGLLRRLRKIEELPQVELSVEDRLRIVRELDRENWGIKDSAAASSPLPEPSELGTSLGDLEGHKTGVTG